MSPDQGRRSRRVRSGKESSRTGGVRKKTKSNASAAASQPPPENPSDIHALCKARLEYLEKSPEEGRKKMRYVGEIVAKAPATRRDVETAKKASGVRRRHKAATVDSKHSYRRVRVAVRAIDEPDEGDFVYRQAPDTEGDKDHDAKTQIPEAVADKRDAPATLKTRRKVSIDDKPEREERRNHQRRQSEPLRRRNSNGIDNCPPVRRYEILILIILPELTSPEHLLLEAKPDHHRQRVSPIFTTSLSLHCSELQLLRDRGLKFNCLVRTQHRSMQGKPLASSPACFLLPL
jgi:hypothetical protein